MLLCRYYGISSRLQGDTSPKIALVIITRCEKLNFHSLSTDLPFWRQMWSILWSSEVWYLIIFTDVSEKHAEVFVSHSLFLASLLLNEGVFSTVGLLKSRKVESYGQLECVSSGLRISAFCFIFFLSPLRAMATSPKRLLQETFVTWLSLPKLYEQNG